MAIHGLSTPSKKRHKTTISFVFRSLGILSHGNCRLSKEAEHAAIMLQQSENQTLCFWNAIEQYMHILSVSTAWKSTSFLSSYCIFRVYYLWQTMHFVCFLYTDYILICILNLHYSLPNSSPLHVRRSKAHLLGPRLLNDRPPSRWNSIARLVFKGLWKMAFFCAFKFFAGRQRGQVNRKGKGRSLEIIDEEDGHILCVAWPLPPQPRFGTGGGLNVSLDNIFKAVRKRNAREANKREGIKEPIKQRSKVSTSYTFLYYEDTIKANQGLLKAAE